MRPVLLIAALVAMAAAANAETRTETTTTTTTYGPPVVMQPAAGDLSRSAIFTPVAPDPGNCGTPDEFKPCPPLPRVPLQSYPADNPG